MTSYHDTFCLGPTGAPDKYELLQQFGAGGEAQLWKATLHLAGVVEPVAVKMLRPERMDDFDALSARWAEQAELLRFVRHPGVVGIREHFEGVPAHPAGAAQETPGRSLYLVMNWVEGHSVRDWVLLISGAQGLVASLKHIEQIAEVLDWLHSGQATPSGRGVVHGDLSPGNVMINSVGQAILVDFGLVRLAAHHTVQAAGTLGYAAPEVWATGEYTPATDRYSFGAMAYFMLTGEDPHPDPDAAKAALAALPLIARVSPDQLNLLTRIFSHNPVERPSAVEWARALRSGATATARRAAARPQAALDTMLAPVPGGPLDVLGHSRYGGYPVPEPKRPKIRRGVLAGLTVLGVAGIGLVVANSLTTLAGSSSLSTSKASASVLPTPTTAPVHSPDRAAPPDFHPPATSPPAPGPPETGTYAINRIVYSDSDHSLTLESIEITADYLKVNILYKNTGDRNLGFDCLGYEDPKQTFLSIDPSETVYATDTFCMRNPSLDSTLLIGETKRSWAIYPSVLTSSNQPFSVRWYPEVFGRGVEGIVLGRYS